MERALDLGVNVIDTAEVYAYGRSERIVGAAIRDRRDDVFLATKVFPVLPIAPVVRQRAVGVAITPVARAELPGPQPDDRHPNAIDFDEAHTPMCRRCVAAANGMGRYRKGRPLTPRANCGAGRTRLDG